MKKLSIGDCNAYSMRRLGERHTQCSATELVVMERSLHHFLQQPASRVLQQAQHAACRHILLWGVQGEDDLSWRGHCWEQAIDRLRF